jgi:hypothetical protein
VTFEGNHAKVLNLDVAGRKKPKCQQTCEWSKMKTTTFAFGEFPSSTRRGTGSHIFSPNYSCSTISPLPKRKGGGLRPSLFIAIGGGFFYFFREGDLQDNPFNHHHHKGGIHETRSIGAVRSYRTTNLFAQRTKSDVRQRSCRTIRSRNEVYQPSGEEKP